MSTPAKPGSEQRRMNVFVGEWDARGEIEHEAESSGIRSRHTYEWLPGGFFLVHKFQSRLAGGKVIEGVEIIEHDGERYVAHYFDSNGNARHAEVEVTGTTWTFSSDNERGILEIERDTITITWERPDGTKFGDLTASRVQ
jgi:hypothetical protein